MQILWGDGSSKIVFEKVQSALAAHIRYVCSIDDCVCNQRLYFSQQTSVFAKKNLRLCFLRTLATEGNPTAVQPLETNPVESATEEDSEPTDSELQELEIFDSIHFSDTGNPIVLLEEEISDMEP